ncbi:MULTISPECIES: ImmA/IrrE family metallo-endopeptidase [Pseudomonas]|uniref:ImmA/IrrE family metallo-endopeptidase n=1 Tax=Pseudomonas palleroniana TaxID=191390 RepID=A0A1H5KNT4_9PSED|nr:MULTISPECIES: ImmA/IrrE family metallo-endopeptidase [Pseudomonas]KAB0568426.1 ImmA/IrrE family metallo-endopeptidase [Pseudomonas palleroniana]PTC28738.1 ImmA/IrrE family metallo-endopeptidase [Pseudomonas palleroniana]SEE66097.1 Zn-dependent peptidase ImmA, M78 family [Pseudomonas palleroniana]
MLSKSQIRAVTTRAAEVIRDSGAKRRIEEDGYTRVDPFRIAQSAGVVVMLRPLEKLFGAFIDDGQPGILVNSERPAGLIQMTCAHELGHFFLHHGTTTDDQLDYANTASKKELEADWFAYSLVAPRWAVAKIMKRKGWSVADLAHPFILYQLALRLGISYKAAIWSLNRLQLLDRSVADDALRVQPASIKRSLLDKPLDNSQRDVWLLDERDRDLILEPRVDDQVLVRLKNHTGSGYVWTTDEAASEGFSVEPLMMPTPSSNDENALIAGGMHYQDYLVCSKTNHLSGSAQLLLSERKAWNRAAPPLDSFSTYARYEDLANGLSPVAKEFLLQGTDRS